MIFDTHAHLNDPLLQPNKEKIIQICQQEKIFINCIGTNLEDSQQNIFLAQNYHHIFATIGIHPSEIENIYDVEQQLIFLEQMINAHLSSIIAIGETGLNYLDSTTNQQKQNQQKSFIKHIQLSQKYHLPLIIHLRDAWEDGIKILEKYAHQDQKMILHCFTGSLIHWEKLKKYKNLFVSLSGIITFKKSNLLCETVKHLPLDRILVETDCPYLAPVPFRGQTNQPQFVVETIKFFSQLIGSDEEKIISQLWKNSLRALNLLDRIK